MTIYTSELKENTPENIKEFESYFPRPEVYGGMNFSEQMTCFEICTHYYQEWLKKNGGIEPTEDPGLSILEQHLKFFGASLERIKGKHVFAFDSRSKEEKEKWENEYFINLGLNP